MAASSGVGDGGSAGDPMGNGQNLGALLGKILRIDVSAAEGAYRVPADNPFVGQASTGARPEVWAYGLRNPWRFSFDPATGRLWVADVGQDRFEEIDLVQKGGNYGWNRMEGRHCFSAGSAACDPSAFNPPLFEYDHASGGCSVTGGFVYQGAALPRLRGAYVYGDYCSGQIRALRYDGARVTDQGLLADTELRISAFGQDSAGSIFVLDHSDSGGVFRLTP